MGFVSGGLLMFALERETVVCFCLLGFVGLCLLLPVKVWHRDKNCCVFLRVKVTFVCGLVCQGHFCVWFCVV